MLRVGLTGGLGSGKSTVAGYLREFGAQVIEADALGRELMEPGEKVYEKIVKQFGKEVVNPNGRLKRGRLAELAFQEGRLQELNAIVHPATVAAQGRWMREVFDKNPRAIAVVESALIFEVVRDALARGERDTPLANLRRRFDRVVLVTARDELKVARYAERVSPPGRAREVAASDARIRLAHQIPDAEKVTQADYVIDNSADLDTLRKKVIALWERLEAENNKSRQSLSLE
ncbi:MAG TPA: dephospho-CoA kinase [Terracidiphilus sp.]|nr:dephospho-CoA kinase [Terracidiphilus sp.]